jgi:phosphoribosylformylglycinamidine synthase
MQQIFRVYVEKRPGFAVEAEGLKRNLMDHLHLSGLEQVRIFVRYDVEGIDETTYLQARDTIFSEPNQDVVYEETLPDLSGWYVFGMEYLPGQYDQRADSAAQCIQILSQGEAPALRTAKIYALRGALTEEQKQAIEAYCINPIEAGKATMDKPETLAMQMPVPQPVPRIAGFCEKSEEEIRALHAELGLAMSVEDLLFTQTYFAQTEHRDPTMTEIRVLDTYWSDHCRHTTFATILDEIILPEGPMRPAFEKALAIYEEARKTAGRTQRPHTLMDLGTVGAKALKNQGVVNDLDESDEINACSVTADIKVDGKPEKWLLEFKNETHNHPTEIEPFGGAATCLGGAIRDILASRAYTHQAMRVTGCADPNTPVEKTVPGRLQQRRITTGAAHGFSAYGNQIGLATGQVAEIYHPGYVAKRMEIGAVVGAVKEENVVREEPQKGDVVILFGGRTGRDGIGGATGSSVSHDAKSLTECGSQVQKGNAPTERKIQRLVLNPEVTKLIKRCNDFGAGGVSVAIGELAPGLVIDLDVVPKKYEGLDGTELAISESQERMAVVVESQNVDRFIQLCQQENLEAVKVAEVTEDNRLVMRWRGDAIVDIDRAFLDTNGVTQHAKATVDAPQPIELRQSVPKALAEKPLAEALCENMQDLNVCAQKGLVERFDSTIGARSVFMPFAGKNQTTPEQVMAAKFPTPGETDDATSMAYGFTPAIAELSPLHAGAYAVTQALCKVAASGADALSARLSLQEYFESLKQNPNSWGKPVAALLGALSAQMGFGTPAIGGKDSMSGTFKEYNVPPTLVAFAIAKTKATHLCSAAAEKGQWICKMALPVDEYGMPDFDLCKQLFETVYKAHRAGLICAASTVAEGGLAAAVAKMCFGNGIGVAFEKQMTKEELFAWRIGDLLLAVEDLQAVAQLPGAEVLGHTTEEEIFAVNGEQVEMEALQKAWRAPLETVFPTQVPFAPPMQTVPLYTARSEKRPKIKVAKPRVIIPVWPGTNCELDTARVFELAGAVPEIQIVNNLSPAGIEDTIERIAKGIDNAQILMLPGGFSAGDEPDGSGKFIATTLRNPRIAQAIERLLQQRDGLALGICNGFQALIKLGLLPNGKIETIQPGAPTLTYNAIGRHASCMVRTRITSTLSPWMSLVNAGDVHCVPVSHGEGRFVADEKTIEELAKRGQIATQYVDFDGVPSGEIAFNPNGSASAIEGITSPDGRVFGKMGHSERIGQNVAKNVPGNKDQKLFQAGVNYFA